mmetsp:Transcript_106365/g.266501  ORF Transcript_106365/g.266501 Transcript_106365/m.266501 type:complete len:98 (+) Transcript_106365:374-667(+)
MVGLFFSLWRSLGLWVLVARLDPGLPCCPCTARRTLSEWMSRSPGPRLAECWLMSVAHKIQEKTLRQSPATACSHACTYAADVPTGCSPRLLVRQVP